MEDNQKIQCSVESCVYQDSTNKRCTLHSIQVLPRQNTNTRKADESMCGSYECCE